MAPNQADIIETGGDGITVPAWINEENFSELVQKQVRGFLKIRKFEAGRSGGAGENYASVILRIKIIVALQGGSTKDLSYMMKTLPQSEQTAAMINIMGFFPKELTMYTQLIPEFEHMYKIASKNITLGPKCYKLANDPGTAYVLMEDIAPKGFKNQNRLEGLDKEHTEAVLRMIAQLHAASAVRYETKGRYEDSFVRGNFNERSQEAVTTMLKNMEATYIECLLMSDIGAQYVDQVKQFQANLAENIMNLGKPDLSSFNVINHGDCWSNNIMFRHDDEGKLMETIFVDFQLSVFASPAIDLFYFLLSSTKLELKVSHFDEFVKYYHDHLVGNLKLLHYPKDIPTLKELHMDLLKYSFMAMQSVSSVMAGVLLDPTKDANMDNFIGEDGDGNKFKFLMYRNPRYVKHMETILPWLDARGYLD